MLMSFKLNPLTSEAELMTDCKINILLFLAGPFLCFCMPWLLGVASLCVELFRQSSFTAPSNGTFTPWAACTSISASLVDSSEPPLSSCWTQQSHWPHVLAYCCRRTEGTCFTTNTVFRTLTYWLKHLLWQLRRILDGWISNNLLRRNVT